METALVWILVFIGLIMALFGFFGCLLPTIPGPAISFAALIVLSLAYGWEVFSPTFLIIMAVLTVLVLLVDGLIPLLGAKRYGASKWGMGLSVAGMVAGLIFFPPWGIILGTFAGAMIGEIIAGKEGKMAFQVSWGIFLGNLAAIGMKLAFTGVSLVFYVWNMFG